MTIEPLRNFQEEDVPFFLAHKKSLILYEPRLGKTVVTCNVLAADRDCQSILILCSKNALGVWQTHLKEWFQHLSPEETIDVRLIRGKGSKAKETRQQLYLKPRTANRTFYVSTFSAFLKDYLFLQLPSIRKTVSFDTVIGDEVHLHWCNRNNKSVAAVAPFVRTAMRFHALSGTMTGKTGPASYWAVLNMIDRKMFSSYWRLVNTFCEVADFGYGKQIIGVKNLDGFHSLLDRYSRTRKRKECAPHMPAVQRSMLNVPATPRQKDLYDSLVTDQFAFTEAGDKMVVVANSLEQTVRLRQVLTCPALLDPLAGVGGAMEDLIERLQEAKENQIVEDYHVVIFSQFKQALPHFENALRAAGFSDVVQLYGGIEPEEQEARIAEFRRTKGIVLCSIDYAQAFSLTPATQCFFIGYSWDPSSNKQAEDRLVPQQGTNPINAYYYAIEGTVDSNLCLTLDGKQKIISVTTKGHGTI